MTGGPELHVPEDLYFPDTAAAGAVAVRLAPARSDVVVQGDAGQLQRVFDCLADNGVTSTPPGGWIDVVILIKGRNGSPVVTVRRMCPCASSVGPGRGRQPIWLRGPSERR